MSITVEIADRASEELLAGLNHLIPQLSTSTKLLTMADLETLVASPTSSVFVASHSGKIVGTLTLVVFPIPTGLRAWIEDVVVDSGARRLGVGEALTSAAIDTAQRDGVRSVDLTSRPSREAAHSLYLKLGFKQRDTNVYRLGL